MPENIIVHQFGEVESYLVEALNTALEQQFKMGIRLGERLSVPAKSYARERRQYLSTELLKVLATQVHDDARVRLGITNVDLFVSELNFVFGEASSALSAAVFSTARLDPRATKSQRIKQSSFEGLSLRRFTKSATYSDWANE
jgi:archaemetzincin